jgi:predicted ester cyclase
MARDPHAKCLRLETAAVDEGFITQIEMGLLRFAGLPHARISLIVLIPEGPIVVRLAYENSETSCIQDKPIHYHRPVFCKSCILYIAHSKFE